MRTEKPLVSIIMCCYNGEQYISRSFGSILAQTYDNIELIFVNDGSNDNTIGIAESYIPLFAERNYSLHIISQQNQGFVAAYIKGIANAAGQYLSLLDVDDYLFKTSIEEQVNYLNQNADCNVVRTNAYVVNENNLDDTSNILVKRPQEKRRRYIFNDLLFGLTNNFAGTYMVRTASLLEFYNDKKIPVSKYGQNLQLLLPLTYDAPCGFIDKPLFKYIRHIGSHSNQTSLEKRIELQKGYWEIRYVMLDIMGIDDKELIERLEIQNTKNIALLAYQANDADVFNSYYDKLQQLKGNNIEFRTYHAVMNGRKFQYIYRILFFLYRHLCKANPAY